MADEAISPEADNHHIALSLWDLKGRSPRSIFTIFGAAATSVGQGLTTNVKRHFVHHPHG